MNAFSCISVPGECTYGARVPSPSKDMKGEIFRQKAELVAGVIIAYRDITTGEDGRATAPEMPPKKRPNHQPNWEAEWWVHRVYLRGISGALLSI